jgi:HD-GYP domain-containing protein (c-di-GMP phosphodiesterase class II)
MGCSEDEIRGLYLAATIHDLGKISIPAEILSKPKKLTALEYELIKTHAQNGYDILKDVDFPWPLAQIVLQHHERLDGSGYPQGLKSEQIILQARILAVADVVEAISSHRPYRPGLGMDVALAEILFYKGILFDSFVVEACTRLFHEKGFVFT